MYTAVLTSLSFLAYTAFLIDASESVFYTEVSFRLSFIRNVQLGIHIMCVLLCYGLFDKEEGNYWESSCDMYNIPVCFRLA